ncbi:GyrI-like domain-containing protein [Prolixibacter sp. NT017]|uniref:GyrI-like domain-containing protein n=1 Tax=Prolixibacter sp. NT017 TaxID=2652390 RepID=UPI00126AA3D7|nr:GyrI-like domain-containing protein [Prolixibacter sp. NT017]GET24931.1 hypothetical protein NT017_12600 [Prolixibacter sp. NT017]
MREYRIKEIPVKKLVGKRMTMSFAENQTGELWKSFMPRRREITNNVNQDLISMQVYPAGFFRNFNPTTPFEKWAAVEVNEFNSVPEGMETYVLPEGLYVVFIYHGKASDAAPFFQHILGEWLPQSDYQLDDRPHFEILGEKYKNDSPYSEEEIWIPVKEKSE